MMEAIVAAIDKKELPTMEPGAMCYMLSKQGYLSDRAGHWHPHLMFFIHEPTLRHGERASRVLRSSLLMTLGSI
jgi:hypothetical protein